MSRKPQQSGTISMKLVRRFGLKTGINIINPHVEYKQLVLRGCWTLETQ